MPTDEIGPYYKMFGVILMCVGSGIGILHAMSDPDTGMWDVILVVVPLVAGLGLVRPNWFDSAFKSFMNWLPNKYVKPEDPEK